MFDLCCFIMLSVRVCVCVWSPVLLVFVLAGDIVCCLLCGDWCVLRFVCGLIRVLFANC